jgi:peptidoglycan/xylan/chitin deacetylase (PgdA/CDA1 family)
MLGRGALARCVALGALCLLAASSAEAAGKPPVKGEKLAYFQEKNIGRNGLRGTHTVALTFDDGPNENSRGVLSALAAYGIKATFFIVGNMAKTHPNVLKEVAQQGHLLANHSATHARLGQRYERSEKLLLAQVREVNNYIAPLMKPNEPLFFRAPYGYWTQSHARVLNRDPVLKYYIGPIFWDVGGETHVDEKGYVRTSADWDCWERGWKAETCAKGYLREIAAKDGGVVLMHAIHSKAADLVRAVVPVLQREGYTFVRLDQLKEYDKYKTPRVFNPLVAMAEPARDQGLDPNRIPSFKR